jgi:hypothetical protein
MLVAAANIGGHDLENHSMFAFSAARANELWEADALNLDLPRPYIHDSTIACHDLLLLLHTSFEGCGARFRHGMILLARTATHADGANHLTFSFERNAARKDHDATVVGRMDPEELAPRLRILMLPIQAPEGVSGLVEH